MMSKIIIHNTSSLLDEQALTFVSSVIEEGRISNNGKNYCYMTILNNVYDYTKNDIAVSARRNKNSDTFHVWDYPTKLKQLDNEN